MKNFKGVLYKGSGPERDWKLILSAGIIGVVLLSAANIYVFIVVQSWFNSEPQSQDVSMININRLKSVNQYYSAQAAQFNNIVSGHATSSIQDPSI